VTPGRRQVDLGSVVLSVIEHPGPATGGGVPVVLLPGTGLTARSWDVVAGSLATTHPVVAVDLRGHGSSEWPGVWRALVGDASSAVRVRAGQGFLHPIAISGALEQTTLQFIVRDFTDQGLKQKEELLEAIVKDVMKDFPHSSCRIEIKQQYRNMKQVIDRHPEVVDCAMEAIRRAGLEPKRSSIRGGTDGSRLSFMGLPCPNIFAGEHAFHSRTEWVSVQDMEAAVRTIVHLAMVWEELS